MTGQPIDPADEPTVEFERFQRVLALGDEAHVRIVNPLGDIRVRNAGGGEPLFSVVIQRIDGEQRPIDFDIEADGGSGSIRIGAADDFNGRVDAVLLAPNRSHIVAETVGGLIEIRRSRGGADATSESGDINFRTGGRVSGRTATGDIAYSWRGDGNWRGRSELETGAGDIVISLPRSVNASIDASAGGGIDNALPVDIVTVGESDAGTLTVQVNDGGNEIHARTGTGNLTIQGY